MRTKTCLRVLLSVVAIAAAGMAPARAQSVEPPITKDIVDADSGEKLGNITFEWLTTIAGGITDFDLEGFTEADLFPDLFAFPGPAFWEIDPDTGDVLRVYAGLVQGAPPTGGGWAVCHPSAALARGQE